MKNCNLYTFVLHFIMVLVLIFKFFLHNQSAKEAPASHFYSLQHVENGRKNNYVIRVDSPRNHILKSRSRLVSNI